MIKPGIRSSSCLSSRIVEFKFQKTTDGCLRKTLNYSAVLGMYFSLVRSFGSNVRHKYKLADACV